MSFDNKATLPCNTINTVRFIYEINIMSFERVFKGFIQFTEQNKQSKNT